jgi:hypothetical protein
LRYLIEARELTKAQTHRRSFDIEPERSAVDAENADDAISQFVRESDAELLSFTNPRGRESIATVRRQDAFYLVRIYTD